MEKRISRLLTRLFVFMLAVLFATGIFTGCSDKEEKSAVLLKVGLMSDPHFIAANNWGGNAVKALTYFRDQEVDAIVIAGDMVDKAFSANYQEYTKALETVFGAAPPQMILTMGNHDFWKVHGSSSDKDEMYTLFEKETGQSPNYTVKVKGYTFISISPTSGDLSYKANISYLEARLAEAAAEDPEKPIFVVAHSNAANTTVGSSSTELKNALKDYPQAVLFSGHTHYACQDERTIYQEDFTSVDLGSVAYSAINEGNYGNLPSVTGQANVFVRLLTVTGDKMEIKRVNAVDGAQEKQAYEFKLPLKKEEFTYTSARAENAVAPEFAAGASVRAEKGGTSGSVIVSFPSAQCENDMVYGYRIRVANTDTAKSYDKQIVYFATDFYKGVKNIAGENSYTVKNLTPGETYEITVTARESFGKWSGRPLTVTYTAE